MDPPQLQIGRVGRCGPSSGAKLNPSDPIDALYLMTTRSPITTRSPMRTPGMDQARSPITTFAPIDTCGRITVPAPMRLPAPMTT